MISALKVVKSEAEGDKKIVFIEAGTGSGKTVLNNLAGTSYGDRLIYLSRTRSQNEMVIKELKKLGKTNPDENITGIQLSSRKVMCQIDWVRKKRSKQASAICKKFVERQIKFEKGDVCVDCRFKFGECPEVGSRTCTVQCDAMPLDLVPDIVSMKDLVDIAADNRIGCPYITAKKLATMRDVFSGSYLYLAADGVREAIQLPIEGSNIIFDEGHNLENLCCDLLSRRITNFHFNKAIGIISGKDILLVKFFEYLRSVFLKLVETSNGKISGEDFCTFLVEKKLSMEILEDAKEKLANIGYEDEDDVIPEILDLFSATFINPKIYGLIPTKKDKPVLELVCLDPAYAFSIFKKARSIIICSGTLSPISLQKEILGVPKALGYQLGTLINPNNVKYLMVGVGTDDSTILTSAYKHRNKHPIVYDAYREAVLRLASISPSGTLAFFPSTDFVEKCEFPDIHGDLEIYIDSKKDAGSVLDLHRETIKNEDKSLLISYYGGRPSEGADFPGDLCRVVIMCGIQFPPYNDPKVEMKRDYYNNQAKGRGGEWYYCQGFLKWMQAAGRGWRTIDDLCCGVALEDRLSKPFFKKYLPTHIMKRTLYPNTWSLLERNLKKHLKDLYDD